MKALNLIEESNEILQLADGHPGVGLVGQSKEEARSLLNNVKACRMEFRELRIPDDDEVLTTLINARRDLLLVLTESDNFEYANGTRAAAVAPAQSSPPPPSQPARKPETGLRYMLAMRQLDCEIGRLRSPRLIDIAPGADVKPVEGRCSRCPQVRRQGERCPQNTHGCGNNRRRREAPRRAGRMQARDWLDRHGGGEV